MSAADDREEQITKELNKHSDVDVSWGKWYCECGFRLRSGHTELAAHQRDVERKLREGFARG